METDKANLAVWQMPIEFVYKTSDFYLAECSLSSYLEKSIQRMFGSLLFLTLLVVLL